MKWGVNLHVLQLLFSEGMLFLQRLVLDPGTDQLSLHLSTFVLQLKDTQSTRAHCHVHTDLTPPLTVDVSFTSANREFPLELGSWAC